MLPLIPCNIHIAHNAFRAGLDSIGEDAEELALDIHRWLHLSPCHTYDYLDVQMDFDMDLDQSLFIRHVQSRWLTLTAALERIVQKWAVLEEYFLVKAPQLAAKQSKQAEKYLRENSWYKRICQKLRSATMLSEIHFIINVGKHLDKFLLFFQTEGPLIHLLYDELNSTLRSIMLCFLKQDVVGEKRGNELISIDLNKTENYLNVKQMDVGQKTRKAMEAHS